LQTPRKDAYKSSDIDIGKKTTTISTLLMSKEKRKHFLLDCIRIHGGKKKAFLRDVNGTEIRMLMRGADPARLLHITFLQSES